MTPSRRRLLGWTPLGLAPLLAAGLAPAARAQLTVYDPAAVAQMLKQVSQGLQQIQTLQAQLANSERMLQTLGLDVTGPLRDIASQATGLLRQAQGLGYTAADISREFAALYPGDLAGLSPAALADRLKAWSQASRQTLQDALQVQNQIAQAQGVTAGAVGAAVDASQAAAGQTAAIQATNQLLAALSTQLTQLQVLLITQGRQAQTYEAEKRALASKAEADRERLSVLSAPPPSKPRNSF
ncbi:conjugal transfer protein TrbJ [Caulobacter endophyticus]|uniref:conjugal transfer protein TrbJ n=1 Tax=Caulobacter endophyticus TaxID=2172652 RepID=UPI00240F9792|nr:conjugal transfer protein TrbJ [Caulobacter endophyticus]MDG2528253.1 conjugal transfer protein TrbJ [Caulobacter endophyticus]